MPNAPKRPCSFPGGCKELVDSGRCAAHTKKDDRRNSSQRGYDSRWQRLRKWFLMQPENAICADCRRAASTDAHHVRKIIDYPDERLDPDNLRGLCGACHRIRTARGE